jgi:hypothetical protein
MLEAALEGERVGSCSLAFGKAQELASESKHNTLSSRMTLLANCQGIRAASEAGRSAKHQFESICRKYSASVLSVAMRGAQVIALLLSFGSPGSLARPLNSEAFPLSYLFF